MALTLPALPRALKLTVYAIILAATSSVAARQGPDRSPGPSTDMATYLGVFTADHFDVSRPLTDYPDLPPAMQRVRIEEIHVGGPLGPQDVDESVQQDFDLSAEIPAAGANFDAFDNTSTTVGPTPPDPVGDVGPNHYVAMANSRYAVYNKAGALVFGPININTLWAGFGGPCQVENAGDPVVVYDQLADRWVLMQFTAAGPTFFVCLAISTTGNPAGAFFRYAINRGGNFPDYPKLAMWPNPNAYVITTREFTGGTFAGVGVFGLNRAQALAGVAGAQIIGFLATPTPAPATPYNVGDGLLPADFDGNATHLPPAGAQHYLLGSRDDGGPYGAPSDALNLWKFNPNFANPAASTLALTNTLGTAVFDSMFPCAPGSRDCIPQPGTAQKIDHQGYRQRVIHRLAYRNHLTHESLVTNQSVEAAANMSGIRWYELRNPTGAPFIHQQGTYAPGTADGIHRWFGSTAQDQNGNQGLGYSSSNGIAPNYPSVRYTGRLATDPAGTMPQGEGTFVAGTGSQTGSARWGDYTSMNIDPVDDCTYWYVNQYNPVTNATGWRLRVGSFRFPQCAPKATITSLWPVPNTPPGVIAPFWALVRNDGTTVMPGGSTVWFYTNATASGAFQWAGFASVAGLAPGASGWYLLNYTVPAGTAAGAKAYYAQVWFNNSYPQSPLTGPQAFTVVGVQTAVVDRLYPVRGAYPGGVATLWALVRNTGTTPLVGDARVWFWTSTAGADVGSAAITGLAAGQSRWYALYWSVPAATAPQVATYWAQARVSGAPISPWKGPENFRIGFNYQFSSAADAAAWPAVSGDWSLVGNAWLYSVGLPNTASSVRHPAATRYLDYEVRVWRYGCMSCANRIMIRGVPTPLVGTNQWDSHFFFQFTGDGQFSVFKTVAGVLTAVQNWAPSPSIAQGPAYNTQRVVSNGDFLQYYINNVLVWQGYDPSIPAAGQVGVGFYNDASLGNSFYIDSARGIPTALGLEGAELAPAMSTDEVSEAQLQLNAEANAKPKGTLDQAPRRR